MFELQNNRNLTVPTLYKLSEEVLEREIIKDIKEMSIDEIIVKNFTNKSCENNYILKELFRIIKNQEENFLEKVKEIIFLKCKLEIYSSFIDNMIENQGDVRNILDDIITNYEMILNEGYLPAKKYNEVKNEEIQKNKIKDKKSLDYLDMEEVDISNIESDILQYRDSSKAYDQDMYNSFNLLV